ncbi:hypothetical protein Zmor_013722 [Zophobas morio]|uniref:Gustatory receptor n=1 Tax=Zophobas morio TaxID=2755281 RepID=A0AA38IG17_9CUCU|nr:hypothetical protein Zmor_013722 [Zophobas morio]
MGFFPVQGLFQDNFRLLKFSWFSLKTIYSLLLLLFSVFVTTLVIVTMIIRKNFSDYLALLIYSSFQVLGFCSSIQLAQEWPRFIALWQNLEDRMGNFKMNTRLVKNVKVLMIVFTILKAAGFMVQFTYQFMVAAKQESTVAEVFKFFALKIVLCSHVFHIVGYNFFSAVVIWILYIQITLISFFTDFMLIALSGIFVTRLKQLKNKIKALIKTKNNSSEVWKRIREEHYELCYLCETINNKLGFMVLVSYFTNLFLIVVNGASVLKITNNIMKTFSFNIANTTTVLRILSISFYPAALSEEHSKIQAYVLSVPVSLYNLEISRLTDQVLYIEIALSGKRFFTVRKRAVLTIAGIVATYQLVLNQLNTQIVPNFNTDSSSNKTAHPKN